jgi:hypothetical protein
MKYTGAPTDRTLNIGDGRTHLVRELDLRGKGAAKLVKAFWLKLQNDRWISGGSTLITVPGPKLGKPAFTATIPELQAEDRRMPADIDACRFCGIDTTTQRLPIYNQRGATASNPNDRVVYTDTYKAGDILPTEPYHECTHRPRNIRPSDTVYAHYSDRMATIERSDRLGLFLGSAAIQSTIRAK